ncbi:hypothetical protein C8Q79DRAFT_1003623 [Trametes meyenii]|nr:hypothetical protein C8Q79DRAFT_1003623 [Trametes meyenii]
MTDCAELKEFVRPHCKYAILSHVWEEDPVEQSFREVQATAKRCMAHHENPINHVSAKIRRCCQLTVAHRFTYLWADTCCINKDSSAELSEAINSMFAPDHPNSTFRKSKWFKRGWTLQELIAPRILISSKLHTASLLEDITATEAGVLTGQRALEVEDQPYSLVSIFGPHLPTIYGESKEMFIRLQEGVVRGVRADTTLLAWGRYLEEPILVAPSPEAFEDWANN